MAKYNIYKVDKTKEATLLEKLEAVGLSRSGQKTINDFTLSLYLSKKKSKARYYISYSVVATLVYDAVTGIGIGMLFFHQTFMVTFLGQIPFTALHLAGNIVFAGLLSPLIYKWVIENKNLETTAVYSKVKNAFSA